MNYDFTEAEHTLFADIAKQVNALGAPAALEQRDPSEKGWQIRRVIETLAQTPYLRLGLQPVEGFNGQLTLMGAMEVLAGISPSAYLAVEAAARLFGRAVGNWGSSGQKEKFLEPILSGQGLGALALSEGAMNIENEPLATTGEKQGDSVLVTGTKQYVINASIADWIAVAGVCEGASALFIVESQAPGLSVDAPLQTPGYQGTPISAITMDRCKIPIEQVIFPADKDNTPAVLRMWENQILLGASLGISKTAFETARDYAKSHRSGGKPVIAYQEVGFKLAEMLTMLQTAQLLAYRTAWTLENAPHEAYELMLSAKIFCTESAEQICSEAMKILGGSGYISGNPAEMAYRCAKFGQIAGTSTEIARVKIGDAALGYRK